MSAAEQRHNGTRREPAPAPAQSAGFRVRLCETLVSRGLIKKDQLARILKESGGAVKNLAKLLVERKLVPEEKLFPVIAEEMGLPVLSLAKYRIDPEVAKLIPERIARQYTLVPISKLGDRLVVATADPLNVMALDDLKVVTQHAIDLVLAQEEEIRRAIDQAYDNARDASLPTVSNDAQSLTVDGTVQPEDLDSAVRVLLSEDTGEAPVVRVINMMIMEALLKRASDIHLEPTEQSLRVRYRIDGKLMESHRLPKQVQNTVLTRLKILSGCDIAEWRLPQDGRFKVSMRDQEVDFRVSVLPVMQGSKVVMRVLDQKNLSIGLDHLGFLPDSIELFKEAVKRPFGMMLVTGPTGSGKSTTLYSVLSQLNTITRNVITIEDPVEYQVAGITQVQVNADIGLTFASGLRSLLRQSPDVVMIGEIRDFETADIALKASLTGQLVLSTLHTNDAASAVTRLVDMGVEPFLVASSVTLIEAQRLVRKLCPKCRKPTQPPKALLEQLGFLPSAGGDNKEREILEAKLPPSPTFFEAGGCHACSGTGYRGRMGIAEVFLIDERVRELVVAKAQSWEIKRYAIERLGMTPLRFDGLKKAAAGVTTLEEVVRVTSEE